MTADPRLARMMYELALEGVSLPRFDQEINPFALAAPVKETLFPIGARDVAPGARHWYSTGPNNLGGRVRALVVDLDDNRTVFAASASGGVWRTTDGGEHWTPLWNGQESLSMGAIAIGKRKLPAVGKFIYAATGETRKIAGAGVYRSDDGGDHWTRIATAEQLGGSFTIEQIAVHPDDPDQVWVVGTQGAFRSLDATAAAPTFTAFAEPDGPIFYSDVAFGESTVAGTYFLYLVRARTSTGQLVRLAHPEDPVAANIMTALGAAANVKDTIVAGVPPSEPLTLRGRLTICQGTPATAYAVFGEMHQSHDNDSLTQPMRALLRSTNANAAGAFSATGWTVLPVIAGETQSYYNLTIAVSPVNPGHLFVGLIQMFWSTTANVGAAPAFHAAIPSQFFRIDRNLHADEHAIAFEHGADPAVWVGNDGGIVRSTNYATVAAPDFNTTAGVFTRAMLAPNGIRWRKLLHGMVAAQAYDLTQSPLVPTMYGCGHQDNGVWYTAGGDTWRLVMGADGGFVAWDPEDPYRFYATFQGGLSTMQFAGPWERTVPVQAQQVNQFLWPRMLEQGFHLLDDARFAADVMHHPRTPGRLFLTRERRLYGTRDGETFTAAAVGDLIELSCRHEFPQTPTPDPHANDFVQGMVMLEIVGGSAGFALGLFRGVNFNTDNVTPNSRVAAPVPNPTRASRANATNIVSIRGLRRGPFRLAPGSTLELRVRCRDRANDERESALLTVTFLAAAFADITQASADEVARAITTAIPPIVLGTHTITVEGRPVFHARGSSVELFTAQQGPAATLALGGSPAVLTALGVLAAPLRYTGTVGRPAIATLQTVRGDDLVYPPRDLEVAVADASTLTIDVDGSGPVTVTFASPPFANLDAITAEELAIAINAALLAGGKAARAEPITCRNQVVVFGDHAVVPSVPAQPAGPPVPALAILTAGNTVIGSATSSSDRELVFVPSTRVNAFDLGAADTRLRLRSDAAPAANADVTFTAADFADRRRATVDEVVTKLRASLPAARHLRCEVRLGSGVGAPSELAFDDREPARLWVGTEAGQIFLSADDGATWSRKLDPRMVSQGREVQAIAIHPTTPTTIYVGLGGRGNGANDPGALWKTIDEGTSWTPLGLTGAPVLPNRLLIEVDAAGAPRVPRTPLGVYQIVIDPGDGDRIWIATFAGVLESTDAGATWRAFSEGLPHTRVMDLTYVPGRTLLRCAMWGRGTYARDVGGAAPPAAQLFLRTSILDDGAVRPADDGLDGFADFPAQALRWESPDVKVSRLGYGDLGAAIDDLDAAELDEDVVSEPIGQHVAPAANDPVAIFAMIHNRSALPPGDTRVLALFADCTGGIPPLPANAWTTLNAGPPTIDLPWQLAGVATILGGPIAARPRAVRIPFTPAADIGVSTRALGVLVLTDLAAARVGAPLSLDVVELLATERRAAFRLVPTRTARDAEQLILRAVDGVPFTVAESAPAVLGLAAAVATTDVRGNALAAPIDLSGAPVRTLTVTSGPIAVVVRFVPAELTALGIAPAAVTVPDLRRFINRALRLGPLGARCVTDGARLVVRADGRTADLIAADTAFPTLGDATAALASGAWITLGRLKRSTANSVYLRIRNTGGAIEPSLTWRAFWFDPAVAPIALDAAHQLGTGVVAPLAPGAEQLVVATHDPGAAAGLSHVGVIVWAHSDGDPVRLPAREPLAPGDHFDSAAALDRYCARHPNVAYRLLELFT